MRNKTAIKYVLVIVVILLVIVFLFAPLEISLAIWPAARDALVRHGGRGELQNLSHAIWKYSKDNNRLPDLSKTPQWHQVLCPYFRRPPEDCEQVSADRFRLKCLILIDIYSCIPKTPEPSFGERARKFREYPIAIFPIQRSPFQEIGVKGHHIRSAKLEEVNPDTRVLVVNFVGYVDEVSVRDLVETINRIE